MESKYYGEGKLKLTPQPLADLIGAQRVSVARWEIGLNEPKGANLKALRELQKKAKAKTKWTTKKRTGAVGGAFVPPPQATYYFLDPQFPPVILRLSQL